MTSVWILEIWEEACVFLAVDFQLRPPFPPSHDRATMAFPFFLFPLSYSFYLCEAGKFYSPTGVRGGGGVKANGQTSGVFLKYTCSLGIENEGTVVCRRLPHILWVWKNPNTTWPLFTPWGPGLTKRLRKRLGFTWGGVNSSRIAKISWKVSNSRETRNMQQGHAPDARCQRSQKKNGG